MTQDDILAKIARFAQRTLTAHATDLTALVDENLQRVVPDHAHAQHARRH